MKPPRSPDSDNTVGLRQHLDKVNKTLSNISFGATVPTTSPPVGTAVAIVDQDNNVDAHKVIATSPAAPNTEFAVNHSLGRVPMGMLYLGGSNPGMVYKGATPWTATQIFLKESVGSNTFLLLIV